MPVRKEHEDRLIDKILNWEGHVADGVSFAEPAVQAFAGTALQSLNGLGLELF
jgi:hypothetical protein